MTDQEILDIQFESYDFGKIAMRRYFEMLLATLITEADAFSGKRPFGTGGWCFDLYTPLIENGVIAGELDEEGDIREVDTDLADNVLRRLVKEMCK